MVAPKKVTQQHTSAEVAEMSPEQAMATRVGTATYQRGVPEQAMLDAQRAVGSGVWTNALEHVGDLPHRMNQALSTDITMADTVPKIRSQERNLGSRYGFAREHNEQVGDIASHRGVSEDSVRENVASHGQAYADAHRRTPVYNYPTEVAVDASVALGEGRYTSALGHINHLSAMEFGGRHGSTSYAEGDMGALLEGNRSSPTAEHQQAMVDYLRGRESRTPAITRAATSMLGGPNTNH